ncbi:MAG TPA: Gfo/Idh/MocA family oxidoreductase [Phycisphaerae bacterium]|nr:Gfo/Idh/MocA family oxidoreductase [Phycisphaerae bacterium]
MVKLRAIVVGAGGISRVWFPPLAKEKVHVAAVVDLDRKRAEEAVEKYQLKSAAVATDLDKVLREVKADFVLDLTVPEAHCSVTCKALRAGLHVIGEKPMASSMAEARKMVRASEESGKMYMVSQSRRWNPLHETCRKTIASGRVGGLTTLNCDFFIGAHFGGFRDEMPSPLILDMSIHHFDLARMISGKDPVRVYAEEVSPKGSWYKGDVAANCIFEMTDGVRFAYRGSWCAEGCHTSWNGDWRFIGTKGTMLYADDKKPYGEVVAGGKGFELTKKPLKVAKAMVRYEGFRGGLREMLAFLRTGRKPQCECHDNIKSLAMVFSAIESSHSGKRVPVRVS